MINLDSQLCYLPSQTFAFFICFVIGSEYAKTTLDASIFYGPFARSSLDVRLLCFSQLLREDPNSLPGQLWECPSRPSPLPRAPRVDRIALNFVEGSAWGQQDSIRSVNGDFFSPLPPSFNIVSHFLSCLLWLQSQVSWSLLLLTLGKRPGMFANAIVADVQTNSSRLWKIHCYLLFSINLKIIQRKLDL